MPDAENQPPQGPLPRRRERYAGTHPRKFSQRYKERDLEKFPEIADHVREQGRTPAGTHVAIMVSEVMAALSPMPGEIVADCTVGYGGHATAFMDRIGPTGRLIGFDVDGAELERTRERLSALGTARVDVVRGNFAGIGNALMTLGLDGFDIIFADLGLSSMQIDDPARGFSYKHDGPLDMRMDARKPRSAADWLAQMSADDISRMLHDGADEPRRTTIAAAIVKRREHTPIRRTLELAEIVLRAYGLTPQEWKARRAAGDTEPHPAARTFQALRILVNDEFAALDQLLRAAPACLKPGGRLGIMSFHSGEDRRVKHAFEAGLAAGDYASTGDGVIRAGRDEVRANPRAAAAKLRFARRA